MENQVSQNLQVIKPSNQLITPKLTSTIQSLNTSLSAIKPDNSETTKIITYVLGTVVAGLLVYQYIRNNENLN